MENKAKITLEHEGVVYTTEFANSDKTINEMICAFKGMLISAGYQIGSWEDAIMEEITGLEPEEGYDPELSAILDRIYSRYKDN